MGEQNYRTPDDIFAALDDEFHFDLDAAASAEDAKCGLYLTAEDDALDCDWSHPPRSDQRVRKVFVNPPFGEGGAFVEKAYGESRKRLTVVALVIPSTDAAWWHEYAMKASEIRFLRGRISFINPATGQPDRRNDRPSIILIFKPSGVFGTRTTYVSATVREMQAEGQRVLAAREENAQHRPRRGRARVRRRPR